MGLTISETDELKESDEQCDVEKWAKWRAQDAEEHPEFYVTDDEILAVS